MTIPTPQHVYHMEESIGSTRVDAIGSVNLTDYGSIVGTTAGKLGTYAASFDRNYWNCLLKTTSRTLIPSGNWSLSLWFKSADVGTSSNMYRLFFVGSNSGGIFYDTLSLSASYGRVTWGGLDGDGNGVSGWSTTSVVSDDTWHHVVLTSDGTNVCIYVDGSEVTASASTLSNDFRTPAASMETAVGGYTYGGGTRTNEFDGAIDELVIWTANTLTADDVSDLYNSGSGREYPFPVASNEDGAAAFMMFLGM